MKLINFSNRLKGIELPNVFPDDIINENHLYLNLGDPDFQTPPLVKYAGIDSIIRDKIKYTSISGIHELKDAVVHKFKVINNLDFSNNEVIVSSGAKQVIFNAIFSTLNPRDEVVIFAPYWPSYIEIVKLAGGVPIVVPCGKNVEVNIDLLFQYVNSKTKWIIINTPNNPSGSILGESDFNKIHTVLMHYPNILLLEDIVYELIVFEGHQNKSLLNFFPDLKDRVLIVDSLSKSYAMTGWRIGFGLSSQPLTLAMAKVQGHSTSNACTVSQYAAVGALSSGFSHISSVVNRYQNNRDYLTSYFNDKLGLNCIKPDGGVFCLIQCEPLFAKKGRADFYIKDSITLAEYLKIYFSLSVTPGEVFGVPNYIRISFAIPFKDLKEACKRLSRAIDELV